MNVFKEKAEKVPEERKILKNWPGIVLVCVHTFIFALCTGLAVAFVADMPRSGPYRFIDTVDEAACWASGMVPTIVRNVGTSLSSTALVFYFLANLLQMYIPLRALIQPSFMAGKPSINSFLPLVLAVIFRVISESIYVYVIGTSILVHFLLITLLNLTYSYIIIEIYNVDDDNLPKTESGKYATNLKPWIFEKSELPKYTDAKNKL